MYVRRERVNGAWDLLFAFMRMVEYVRGVQASPSSRVDLFRVLADADRLRLLALCAEDELTVGELAALLGESQPQVTKKSQPLREAGLLLARKDGTRTLLRAAPVDDAVVAAARAEGRALCVGDGSLARVAAVIVQREATARALFGDDTRADAHAAGPADEEARVPVALLPLLAPLLPGHALAVDLGTGEGALLPLLAPLYDRVVAVDRSPARLARCAARIAALGLVNVRLFEGAADDAALAEEVGRRGGADLVLLARVLHHVARPQDAVDAAARLLKRGGHLVVVDFLPHDDESRREQGDVWLGFEPARLRHFLTSAGLEVTALEALPNRETPSLQIAAARRPHGHAH